MKLRAWFCKQARNFYFIKKKKETYIEINHGNFEDHFCAERMMGNGNRCCNGGLHHA